MKIVEEKLLFECLEQFEAGVPVETLLAKHPQAAVEIEKFLTVVVQLQQLRLQPSLAAKRQSQKVFLQQAEQLRAAARQARFSWRGLRQTLLPLASLALFVVLFGFTLLFSAASAVPGDMLYEAKLWVESYQLEQAGDATAVFTLRRQMNDERVREVKAILRTNQTAALAFEGHINTRQGSNWIIAGVPVAVNDQTQVEGFAAIGALVLVNGRAENGHFYASHIVVLEDGPATATVTPTATTTAVATGTATQLPTATTPSSATPTLTATPTASATPDTTSTPTPTLTSTATRELPTATATVTAAPPTAVPPTATPQPLPTTVVNDDNNSNDNNNDNSGGGGNDNGNSNDAGDNSNNNDSNDNSGSNDNNNDNDDNDNDGDNSGSGGGSGNDNDNDNGRNDD
ncbi:MAG: hypothetical protein IPM53_29035 [Anaerolineaceae bacterium]|nr:hypothetical protein [Anaerolineaceae bacterium]